MSKLTVVPVSLRTAGDFIDRHHRHHRRLTIHKYAVGVALNNQLVGVAIVARPANTVLDDGQTLEVARTCTDGTQNANSMLYGAAWRVAKSMGYPRMVTYTQQGESGASLRAAGWRVIANRSPTHGWDTKKRQRNDYHAVFIARTLWGIGNGNESLVWRNETRCSATGCTRVIEQSRTGRTRRFCSPACRVKAHRDRVRVATKKGK
jgi:hypothetical protein